MSTATVGHALLVGVGGALGSLLRWGVSLALPTGPGWPWATLAVNLGGAFLLGLLLESLTRPGAETRGARTTRLLAGTGLLGGFTTYSAFALELWQQAAAGDVARAAGYSGLTVLGGLLAAALGLLAGSRVRPRSTGPGSRSEGAR